ncbi:rRNA pseudouridine synthase [Vagococcus coleopterorum]|uniref:Pseudouridine synthase n=1 Tax=Vagococcus coleopterorum TaxID=2714946 RepID=A0A6G8ALV4_9ENTE|nr:pseudouridine synthase [Vagococcus coleopterorum]QIL46064.1 rRNA pseudouridine synthase [Vagococcus coleopterorum]
MRLDKFLSHTGFGSRKEVKPLLKKSVIVVNGNVVKDGKFNINEASDVIMVNGEIVKYQKYFYYLLNKPKGVISATEDRNHKTVLDLLDAEDFRADLFPVGRLDKDTTGLLLITNDGELSHNLLSPKKHVSKTYRATISGIVTEDDVLTFKKGVVISGDELCKPASLKIININEEKSESTIEVTISEGKYHQVKRMFAAVGKRVVALHRLSMGEMILPRDLDEGHYIELTEKEFVF